MQVLVFETEVRQAVVDQGVRPENRTRIYELVLKATTNQEFELLAAILGWIRSNAKSIKVLCADHTGTEAAKNN